MKTITYDRNWWNFVEGNPAPSTPALWTGRIFGGLAAGVLALDGISKVLEFDAAVNATAQLGYPPEVVFSLGITLLGCVLAYLYPRTSALGAVLLTAYLGGAVATHVRISSPLLTHTLFPTYIAALLWGSLLLRDARLRVLVPWSDWSRP